MRIFKRELYRLKKIDFTQMEEKMTHNTSKHAMNAHERIAEIAGCRAKNNYLIWAQERKLFKYLVQLCREGKVDPKIREECEALHKYFQNYQDAE